MRRSGARSSHTSYATSRLESRAYGVSDLAGRSGRPQFYVREEYEKGVAARPGSSTRSLEPPWGGRLAPTWLSTSNRRWLATQP